MGVVRVNVNGGEDGAVSAVRALLGTGEAIKGRPNVVVVVGGEAAMDPTSTIAVHEVLDGLAESEGRVDYAVFDLGRTLSGAEVDAGYEAMLTAGRDLVLKAPVVTMALLRGDVACECLEFALTCHVLLAEPGTRLVVEGRRSASLRRELSWMLGARSTDALRAGIVDVEEALSLGLVEAVAEAGSLEDAALETARKGLPRHLSTRCVHKALRIAAGWRDRSRACEATARVVEAAPVSRDD